MKGSSISFDVPIRGTCNRSELLRPAIFLKLRICF
jgi:hypothetical protein